MKPKISSRDLTMSDILPIQGDNPFRGANITSKLNMNC